MEDLKDYKVAVYFGRYYENNRTLICSCGTTSTVRGEAPIVCPACKNDNVIDGGDYVKNRRINHGIFTCVEKTDYSFHLQKKEIIVHVKDRKVTFNPTHDWELKYSLKDQTVVLTKDGNEVECHKNNYQNICQFFKWGKTESLIIPIFATEKNQHLYNFAYRKYGSVYYERVNKLGRALMRFLGNSAKLELFAYAGFGLNLENIHKEPEWMNSPETKPHKIFGVPKYMLPILREIGRFTKYAVNKLRRLDGAVGGNNVKIIMEIFKEEASMIDLINTIDTFVELYDYYGYKDVKRLALYLAREVKLEQGIASPYTAATHLRDYVRMCRAMEIEPKEKYPKSLKKMHDIAQMNYKAKEDEHKNMMMKAVVEGESYQKLTYRKNPYAIITPKDASDLIKEGSSLSHCVASYVNDVIDGRCKILFLRETNAIDEPLVTIEVRENNIRQVRGFGNRPARSTEMDFVREWADRKGLNLATH